jgi:hypothetical protein
MSLTSKLLTPSFPNVLYVMRPFDKQRGARSLRSGSNSSPFWRGYVFMATNASTEEVHMRIHSTKRQSPMLCATAAADNRALLG